MGWTWWGELAQLFGSWRARCGPARVVIVWASASHDGPDPGGPCASSARGFLSLLQGPLALGACHEKAGPIDISSSNTAVLVRSACVLHSSLNTSPGAALFHRKVRWQLSLDPERHTGHARLEGQV